jgi:uncharacterized protein YecE (DUF72 family)
VTGLLRSGTSGFAYPAWIPRFYPPGTRPADFLRHYAARFPACELNNTFYQQPSPAKVAAWLAATPPWFRFAVKAQRGGSMRALLTDPTGSVPWLTAPLRAFGDRLGAVLFRIPANVTVDVGRLQALLDAWPPDVPLVIEAQDPSWRDDEVHRRLADAHATLCATELPEDPEPPTIRVTGPFLYLRLRRHDYLPAAIDAWADRLVPFLEADRDVYAFFRHDESGRATELAAALEASVAARLGATAVVAGGP